MSTNMISKGKRIAHAKQGGVAIASTHVDVFYVLHVRLSVLVSAHRQAKEDAHQTWQAKGGAL